MEHYYNNYRKQQKERERIMQSGCLIFAVLMAMMLTAWLVWQRGMLVEARDRSRHRKPGGTGSETSCTGRQRQSARPADQDAGKGRSCGMAA